MTRHRIWAALSLRLVGVLPVCVATIAAMHLVADAHRSDPTATPLAYLLASLVFGCASAGAAMLVYGRHLFDPVRVAERWARQTPDREDEAAA